MKWPRQHAVVFLVLYVRSMHIEGATANAAADIVSTGCVLAKRVDGSVQYLQLTWSLHLQNISEEDITVFLKWHQHGQDGMVNSCINITSNSCTWNYKSNLTVRPMFDDIININLTVESSISNVTLDTKPYVYNQDPYECAKYPPVDELAISRRLGTCLDVSWKYEEELYTYYPIQFSEFRLQYRQSGHESWKNASDILDSSITSYKLCNLAPFTEYIVSVQSRQTVNMSTTTGNWSIITGIWSDRTIVHGMTLETTPTGSVEIADGFSISWDNCDKAAAIRNVTIYWKPVKKAFRNGIITAYIIKVTKFQTKSSGNFDHSRQFLVNGSAVFVSQTLQCSSSYNFTVTAATRAGNSSKSSSIVIPESSRDLKIQVEVIVLVLPSSHNASVEVLWRLGKILAESTTALVLWCRKNKKNHCKEDLNWKSVPANTTSLHVSLPGISNDFIFGVSIRTAGKLSPIQWTACMYWKSEEFPVVPTNVRFDSVSKANSLRVLWDGQPCNSAQSGVYISSYNITLCEASITSNTCTRENKWYTVNSSQTSLEIGDLEPKKHYGVSVVAINLEGKGGQPSRFVFKSLKDRPPDFLSSISTGWKIGLSIIILFLLILMVLGICCCTKKLHHRCSKEVPIDVPEVECENINMLPKPRNTADEDIPVEVAERQALQGEIHAQEMKPEPLCTISIASSGLELSTPESQTEIALQLTGENFQDNQIRKDGNNIAKSPPRSYFENYGSSNQSLCLRPPSVSEAQPACLSLDESVADSYIVVEQSSSPSTGRVTPLTENVENIELESARLNHVSKNTVDKLPCGSNVLRSNNHCQTQPCLHEEQRQISDYCLSEQLQRDGLSHVKKETLNAPFLRSCAIPSEKDSNSFKPNEGISNSEYVIFSTMEQPNLHTPASNTERLPEEIRPERSINDNISENGTLGSYQLFTQPDSAGISQTVFPSPDIAIYKQDTKENIPYARQPEQVWVSMQGNRTEELRN